MFIQYFSRTYRSSGHDILESLEELRDIGVDTSCKCRISGIWTLKVILNIGYLLCNAFAVGWESMVRCVELWVLMSSAI